MITQPTLCLLWMIQGQSIALSTGGWSVVCKFGSWKWWPGPTMRTGEQRKAGWQQDRKSKRRHWRWTRSRDSWAGTTLRPALVLLPSFISEAGLSNTPKMLLTKSFFTWSRRSGVPRADVQTKASFWGRGKTLMLSACLPKWWTNYLQAWQFGQTSFKMDPQGDWHFPWMIIPGRQDSYILLPDGLLVEFYLHNENISYYRSKMKKELFTPHEKWACLKKKNGNTVNQAESQAVIKASIFFPISMTTFEF